METQQVLISLLLAALRVSCGAQSCPGLKFSCDSARCVPGSWRCDGVVDCKDRTDETGCDSVTCAAKYWRCDDGRCVPETWRCDGQSDCRDSSDEANCDVTTTSPPSSTPTTQPVLTPTGDASLLLVATSNQLDMCYVSTRNTRVSPVKTLRGMFGRVVGIDVHISSRTLCWADKDKKTVSCGHLSEELELTKVRVLYSPKDGADSPSGVAVDWVHNLVYWTDRTRNSISAGSLGTEWKGRITLVRDADRPTYIIVYPGKRWIFVAEDGTKIIRYSSTGTDRRILVEENIKYITGLALDVTVDRLFWVDTREDAISSCGIYGGDRSEHKSLTWGDYSGLGVITENNKTRVFYGQSPSGKVMGYSLDSRREELLIDHDHNGKPNDMALFNPLRQPYIRNVCEEHDCSHLCIPKMYGGFICACPEWLTLSEDDRVCQITDERGICTGSYCQCPPISSRFGENCRYEDILFVATDDLWNYVKMLSSEEHELSHPCPGVNARSIAGDVKGSAVWWIQGTAIYTSDVGRGPTLTSCEQVFTEGIVDPRALTLDWLNQNLYWSDSGLHSISVVSLSTRVPATLISTGLGEVRGMAVDPVRRWLYWTNWGDHMDSAVERCGLDGSERQQVVKEGLHTPNGLVIDFKTKRLLIGDPVLQVIVSCTLSGAKCFSLPVSKRPSHLNSVAVYGDYVYWSDEGMRVVYRMRKDNGKDRTVVDDFIFRIPSSIAVLHPDTQPKGRTVCSPKNRGCMICLPTRDTTKPFRCACPNGTVLSVDGKSCKHTAARMCEPGYRQQEGRCVDVDECTTQNQCTHDCKNTIGSFVCSCRIGYKKVDDVSCELRGQEPRMLVVDGRQMHVLDRFHSTKVRSRLLAWPEGYHRKRMLTVDTDVAGGRLFWAERGSIKMAEFQDNRVISPGTVLNSSVGSSECLVYDWIHDALYWTDSRRGRITVLSLPRMITRTVHKRLHKPRAIALDPARGFMYWTTWRRSPAIHKSNFGGTQRSVVIATKNRWPNGLTIDYSERQLYWTDGRASALFCSDMAGRSSRVVVMRHTNKPQLMFSVAVLEDYVYWTDWREMLLSRSRRTGGGIENFPSPALRRPTDVKVVHSFRQIPSVTACYSANRRCSHFCSAAPYGVNPVSCQCPDNMVLDDDAITCKIPQL